MVMPELFVGGEQSSAENGRDAEEREQAGGRHGPANALRPVAVGQISLFTAGCGHQGKDIVLRRPIDIVAGRDGTTRRAAAAGGLRQHHDSFRIGIGKRMKQDTVNDAEDGAGAGDAEREGDKRGESEPRILQQDPQTVAKIVEKRVHIIPRGGR